MIFYFFERIIKHFFIRQKCFRKFLEKCIARLIPGEPTLKKIICLRKNKRLMSESKILVFIMKPATRRRYVENVVVGALIYGQPREVGLFLDILTEGPSNLSIFNSSSFSVFLMTIESN